MGRAEGDEAAPTPRPNGIAAVGGCRTASGLALQLDHRRVRRRALPLCPPQHLAQRAARWRPPRTPIPIRQLPRLTCRWRWRSGGARAFRQRQHRARSASSRYGTRRTSPSAAGLRCSLVPADHAGEWRAARHAQLRDLRFLDLRARCEPLIIVRLVTPPAAGACSRAPEVRRAALSWILTMTKPTTTTPGDSRPGAGASQ